MKKPNIVFIMLVSLAYLSPIFTVFYFRNELSQSVNLDGSDPFSATIVTVYIIQLFKYFKSIWKPQVTESQVLKSRLEIVWAFFYLSISGLILYYTFHYEPNMGYNPVLILFGIFMMIDGNYQAVILPKNVAIESGIGEGYEKNIYRKSQRFKGKFQFYFGLMVFISFIILPNTPKMWLYGIFGTLIAYYIGSWIFMYKNTQIIANSEAKTK